MSRGETARKNLEIARQESIARIEIRDQVLLAYLGAVATVFGVILGAQVSSEILLVVPYLTLGGALIVSQHNSAIGTIGSFVAHELMPFLEGIDEGAPQWETSKSLSSYAAEMVGTRSLGHLLLLAIPSIGSLAANWKHGFYSSFPYGPIWWFGLLCVGSSIYFLLRSHSWRRRLLSKLGRFSGTP